MESDLISTSADLTAFLNSLPDCRGRPPRLYVDLEGNNLSRSGTLSLITILVYPLRKTSLIDVTTLGDKAFTIKGSCGSNLKAILEDSEIIKVFFDIRNDSDALFSLYGIRVAGVEDLQLMELATRAFQKKCVNGLAKCIENNANLTGAERSQWCKVKDQGRRAFDPNRGGSYAVFDQRPLAPETLAYCTQDVIYMPILREAYRAKICDAWWLKIVEETRKRIALSQTPTYNGKGPHMALGPVGWLHWRPSPHERAIRTLMDDHPEPDGASRSPKEFPVAISPSSQPSVMHKQDKLGKLLASLALDQSNDDEIEEQEERLDSHDLSDRASEQNARSM